MKINLEEEFYISENDAKEIKQSYTYRKEVKRLLFFTGDNSSIPLTSALFSVVTVLKYYLYSQLLDK